MFELFLSTRQLALRGAQPTAEPLALPALVDDLLDEWCALHRVPDAVPPGALSVGQARSRAALQARIDAAAADARDARGAAQRGEAPSVAFIEWADPIYVGGHWTPQLIEMAGGAHPLNPAGRGGDAGAGAGKSFAVAPDAVEASSPDVLVVCPCGTVCIPL